MSGGWLTSWTSECFSVPLIVIASWITFRSGTGGSVLWGFQSYFKGSFQRVVLSVCCSDPQLLSHKVLQCSILSLVFFSIYEKPLGKLSHLIWPSVNLCPVAMHLFDNLYLHARDTWTSGKDLQVQVASWETIESVLQGYLLRLSVLLSSASRSNSGAVPG